VSSRGFDAVRSQQQRGRGGLGIGEGAAASKVPSECRNHFEGSVETIRSKRQDGGTLEVPAMASAKITATFYLSSLLLFIVTKEAKPIWSSYPPDSSPALLNGFGEFYCLGLLL
jgi:hypothetical protein